MSHDLSSPGLVLRLSLTSLEPSLARLPRALPEDLSEASGGPSTTALEFFLVSPGKGELAMFMIPSPSP